MGSVGVKEREADDLAAARALHAREALAAAREAPASSRVGNDLAAELVRYPPPAAPDAQAGQRLALPKAAPGATSPANPLPGAATLLRTPLTDPLDRAFALAAKPEAQWPELKVGQGIMVETRDGRGVGFKKEVFAIVAIADGHAELQLRGREQTMRVDLETLRARIGWQYGHPVGGWRKEDGNDVSWTLKTDPTLTAAEPPAMATETIRAVMRESAQRFDAELRAGLTAPATRQRWERVMTLQGRYRELSRQRTELELGREAHVKNRPLRVSSLVGSVIPGDGPEVLRDLSAALVRDPVEAAFLSQIAALDEQMIDVGRASAMVASDAGLGELAATSSDPLVLALAREESGHTMSPAALLSTYLDNADAALARNSTSGALIATAAALQPYLALASERHGSIHLLPAEGGDAPKASLTMAINQMIAGGSVGSRGLVHSSAQLAALATSLSDRQLILLERRHAELASNQSGPSAYVSAPASTEQPTQRRERRIRVFSALMGEVARLKAVEASESHREFLGQGGRELLARADDLTRRALSAASTDELLKFGRGFVDVFDSLNTWVMAGTMLATRGIGAVTFARSMPQLGELLLAYRAGRLSRVAMESAASRLAIGSVGTAATFTTLNNLALGAIGEDRYVDWSAAAFTTNLLALTAFDYIRARSFVRNFDAASAVQSSLGLRWTEGRLVAQQAAEQFAAMNAIGLGSAYLRTGNLDGAFQVVVANFQFLVAMAAAGKLVGNKTLVPREVTRLEQLMRDYRQLPTSAVEARKALLEEVFNSLRVVSDEAMAKGSARVAVDMLNASKVAPRVPSAANVPNAFAEQARALIVPLMRHTPFVPSRGPVTKPGNGYVAVFPSHPLDGDAVGSALATVRALRNMGVEAYISMSQPLPRNLRGFAPRPDELLADARLLAAHPPALAIGLDGQHLFGRAADSLPATTPMLRIDHHRTDMPPSSHVGPGSATWVNRDAQSCGQLVADLIDSLARSHTERFGAQKGRLSLTSPHMREVTELLMVAAYTDVWGGAARPLANANATTLGLLRYLSLQTDATTVLARLGEQLPVSVRKALTSSHDSSTFYDEGANFPGRRTATEVQYPFASALALLERTESKRGTFDNHRDLKGYLLDRLDGSAQLGDVLIALVPETNPAGIAGARFFLRSYRHGDAAELTSAIRDAAVRQYPDKASLIDAGGKQHIGGGWMPLTEEQLRAVMRDAVYLSFRDARRRAASQH